MSFEGVNDMLKHKKLIAALAAAGGLVAMSGAAHAISPAAALGLAAIGGAAVGGSAAQAQELARHDALARSQPQVVIAPAVPGTVVMGAAPATTTVTTTQEVWVPGQITHYDHDGDGVMNNTDRFPNDPARS
jgi:hypothetical protein